MYIYDYATPHKILGTSAHVTRYFPCPICHVFGVNIFFFRADGGGGGYGVFEVRLDMLGIPLCPRVIQCL